jgi:hypothetical protein
MEDVTASSTGRQRTSVRSKSWGALLSTDMKSILSGILGQRIVPQFFGLDFKHHQRTRMLDHPRRRQKTHHHCRHISMNWLEILATCFTLPLCHATEYSSIRARESAYSRCSFPPACGCTGASALRVATAPMLHSDVICLDAQHCLPGKCRRKGGYPLARCWNRNTFRGSGCDDVAARQVSAVSTLTQQDRIRAA